MQRLAPAVLMLVFAGCNSQRSNTAGRADPPLAKAEVSASAGPVSPASPALASCVAGSAAPRLTPLSGAASGTLVLVHAEGRTIAVVADEDDHSIALVDIDSSTQIGTTKLSGKPSQLIATQDGRIIVALADESQLEVLEPAGEHAFPLIRRCLVDVPDEPMGLASTPDHQSLLVASRWGHTLSVLHQRDLSIERKVDLPRDPAAVLSSSDGKRAFVTHAVGGKLSIVDLGSDPTAVRGAPLNAVSFSAAPLDATVGYIDLMGSSGGESRPPVRHQHVGEQSFSMVRSEKGKIFVPQVLAEPSPPVSKFLGYGSSSARAPSIVGEVAVVDEGDEAVSVALAPQPAGHEDCLLPRAAVLDETRSELWVACLGIDSIVAYDAKKPHPHRFETRRIAVPPGPTGVALDAEGKRLVVFSQFDGAITVIPLAKTPSAARAALGGVRVTLRDRQGLSPTLALGRSLFYSAGKRRIADDGRACASCHPEGRDDGMTWATAQGPRQTPILLDRLPKSAPYGWLGDRADLESHFARTIERLSGSGVTPEQRDAIFSWVNSLTAPRRRSHDADEKLARGKAMFASEEARCSTCHEGDASTDGKTHDIGSGTKLESIRSYDTPSLRFVGHSAPYFHDGRYSTIAEMLKATNGAMGNTSHLTPDDLDALVAYVESR